MLSFGLGPGSIEISDISSVENLTDDSVNNTYSIENILMLSTSHEKSTVIIQNTNFGNYANYILISISYLFYLTTYWFVILYRYMLY